MKASFDDALLKLERIPDIISISDSHISDHRPETWNVQVIKCIQLTIKDNANFFNFTEGNPFGINFLKYADFSFY